MLYRCCSRKCCRFASVGSCFPTSVLPTKNGNSRYILRVGTYNTFPGVKDWSIFHNTRCCSTRQQNNTHLLIPTKFRSHTRVQLNSLGVPPIRSGTWRITPRYPDRASVFLLIEAGITQCHRVNGTQTGIWYTSLLSPIYCEEACGRLHPALAVS